MTKLMGLGSGNNKLVSRYLELTNAASGNTGNLLFNFALKELIELEGTDVRWATPADTLNADGHTLLLPMANNIGRHMDLMKSGPKLDGVCVPVVAMGLGAQFQLAEDFDSAFDAIPETSKLWLKQLSDKGVVPNISVRGALTHRVFERLGIGHKAVPLGCPSHFLSSDKALGKSLAAAAASIKPTLSNGIGITAGNPALANLANLERFLISLIDTYGGRYIVQSPKSLLCVAEGWTEELSNDDVQLVRERFFPALSTLEMLTWLRRRSSTYVSIPQWHLDISKFDVVVGTRIHGCQIALQAGVPAVCLYIDSRTKELCETMLVPAVDARDFQKRPSLSVLIDVLKSWDWLAYDQNRLSLANQTYEFVEKNGLMPTSKFKALVR